jgi:hypothetical protein
VIFIFSTNFVVFSTKNWETFGGMFFFKKCVHWTDFGFFGVGSGGIFPNLFYLNFLKKGPGSCPKNKLIQNTDNVRKLNSQLIFKK